MSLNVSSIVARVSSAAVTVEKAQAIIAETIALITTVEQIYVGLKGSEKFQAVQAGVKTLVDDLGLSGSFDAIWRVVGPAVSLIVTIFNLRNLWPVNTAQPVAANT